MKQSEKEVADVLVIADREEWHVWLSMAGTYDFYHTWLYHQLHRHEAEALLLVYKADNVFVGIPFIKRRVHDFDLFDLTSVFGYCGPFSNVPFTDLKPDFLVQFKKAFLAFFEQERIVTVFSGLNPFMDQPALLKVIGGLTDNGKTVVIDLAMDLEEQRKQYRKGIQRTIKRQRGRGWTVRQAVSDGDVETFAEMYGRSMERLDAPASYRFDAEYIKMMLAAHDFDARLIMVYNADHDPVCGAIVVLSAGVLHAHLLATSEEYRKDSPARLLTEEITILCRGLGLKYFNLGGGLGYREDSLFAWKRNFSPLTFLYKTWRYVVNESLYEQMIDRAGIDRDDSVDFFPLYRLKVLKQ